MPFMCSCHFVFILLQVQFYNFNDLFFYFFLCTKINLFTYALHCVTHLSYMCANSSLTRTIQCRVGGLAYTKSQCPFLSVKGTVSQFIHMDRFGEFLDTSPVQTDGTSSSIILEKCRRLYSQYFQNWANHTKIMYADK